MEISAHALDQMTISEMGPTKSSPRSAAPYRSFATANEAYEQNPKWLTFTRGFTSVERAVSRGKPIT